MTLRVSRERPDPVLYRCHSPITAGQLLCNSIFWQIVLTKSYSSHLDTNYHHDIVQTHDADSRLYCALVTPKMSELLHAGSHREK